MFREALNIIDDARRQGPLDVDEQWAQAITGEIAKCDAALGKERRIAAVLRLLPFSADLGEHVGLSFDVVVVKAVEGI